MAKPTILPRWANVGGSVSTPVSGKQDTGWIPGEELPAQHLNWLALHTYNWTAWLNALFPSDNLVLDANKSVTVSGSGQYKHGEQWHWRSASNRGHTETNLTFSGDTLVANGASAVLEFAHGPVQVGKRPTKIAARVRGTGVVQNVTVTLYRSNGDGSSALLQTLTIANPPASWARYEATISPATVALVDPQALYWRISMPANSTAISTVGVALVEE